MRAKNRGRSPAAVATQQQTAPGRIPHRHGEAALKPLDEGLTEGAIKRRDHRHVSSTGNRYDSGQQPGPQLLVVVDLAAADHDHAADLHQRLAAVIESSDGQANKTEPGLLIGRDTPVIGSAMGQGAQHGLHAWAA